GIDTRVLDHLLRSIPLLVVLDISFGKYAEEVPAMVKDVDVAGASDLDARDFFNIFELSLELFRNCSGVLLFARGLFDQFCKFEWDRKRQIAELSTRRGFGVDLLQLDAERLARSH